MVKDGQDSHGLQAQQTWKIEAKPFKVQKPWGSFIKPGSNGAWFSMIGQWYIERAFSSDHPLSFTRAVFNRPRSIYQYSSTAPRLSGKNCKFFKFLLSLNSQRRLGYKENNTKYRILTRKPRSHVRILIYRTWPIECRKTKTKTKTNDLPIRLLS